MVPEGVRCGLTELRSAVFFFPLFVPCCSLLSAHPSSACPCTLRPSSLARLCWWLSSEQHL